MSKQYPSLVNYITRIVFIKTVSFFTNAHVYIISGCYRYVKFTVTNMIVCDCCAVYYIVENEYDKIL